MKKKVIKKKTTVKSKRKFTKKKVKSKRKYKRNAIKPRKKAVKKKVAKKRRKKVAKKAVTKKRVIASKPTRKKVAKKSVTNGFAVAVVEKTKKGPNKLLFATDNTELNTNSSAAAVYKSKQVATKLARGVVSNLRKLPRKRAVNMGVKVIPAFSRQQIKDLKSM